MSKLKEIVGNFFADVKAKDKKAISILAGIIIAILAIVIILVVCLTGGKSKKVEKTTKQETSTKQETTTEEQTTEKKSKAPKGMVRSQLTGEWVSKKIGNRRPIGIMLNNIIDAVPQTSIEKAGVVLEAPVEGGICRFEAFFEDYDDLDKIGSVRSARNYFVHYSKQFDAIYLHFGQSYYALPLLESDEIDNLSGLDAIGMTVFYRTTDRVAPHNAYASASGIAEGIEQMGYRKNLKKGYEGPFQFAEDDEKVVLKNGKKATKIVPGYYVNTPWFDYNKKDGLYYRYQYGEKHIDDLDGAQLTYTNIIFQNCDYTMYGDTPYLNIKIHGKGTGKYFTGGKYIDITWEKKGQWGQTFYYDMDGNPITLNQGKTWICIITEQSQVEIS